MGREQRMMLPVPLNGMGSWLSSIFHLPLSQWFRKPKTCRTQRELNKKENKSNQSMTMIRGSKSDHDKMIKNK